MLLLHVIRHVCFEAGIPWQRSELSRPSEVMAWWRHQMENFSALLAICAGNSPVPGEFPAQRPMARCFDVFFNLRLNKRLSKQSWGWWFETLSCQLWRHRNVLLYFAQNRDSAGSWKRLLGIEESTKLTHSVTWLLMTRRCKEPMQQQPWCWPISIGIFRSQHQKG